jgi:effector-binding domain-containing protein
MEVRIEEREPVATAVIVAPGASAWRGTLDEVWAFVRAHDLAAGRNVMRYGDRVEMGVELASFTPSDRVIASSLPGGPTATAIRLGPPTPEGIAEAHDTVRAWCAEHGHEVTGECWEIYGHMRDDEPFELLVGWPLSRR